jgi:hypothetical protein
MNSTSYITITNQHAIEDLHVSKVVILIISIMTLLYGQSTNDRVSAYNSLESKLENNINNKVPIQVQNKKNN